MFLEQPKVITLIFGFLTGIMLETVFVFILLYIDADVSGYLKSPSTKAFLSNN